MVYVHWEMQESYSKLTKSMTLKQIHCTSLRTFPRKGLGWSTGLANPVYTFTLSYTTPLSPVLSTRNSHSHYCGVSLCPREQTTDKQSLIWLRNRTRNLGLGFAHRVGCLFATQEKGITEPWRTMRWHHHTENEGCSMPWQSLRQTPVSEGSSVWSCSTCKFTMFSLLSSPQVLVSFKLLIL